MENQNVYVVEKKTSGIAIASFVCSLVALVCCNPCYLTSVAAIVLGIIGLVKKHNPTWMSVVGISVGAGAIILWLILDTLLMPFTFGTSYFF